MSVTAFNFPFDDVYAVQRSFEPLTRSVSVKHEVKRSLLH